MKAPKYFLEQTAFICPAQRHWVVLDVRGDCYLSIDRPQFEALGPLLYGWCSDDNRTTADPGFVPPQAMELAAGLLARGILSERADSGKPVTPVESTVPRSAIQSQDCRLGIGVRLVSAPAFLWATARADFRLRRLPLLTLVTKMKRRRNRARAIDMSFDWSLADHLTKIFHSLRLVYPRPYLCMYDSLALLEFFALHSLFPTWVFGVSVDPFRAHCWLQQGDSVIGDSIERVRSYRPIMCV
jgi:hypothetical protein